jgi:hypothetical protein
MNYSDRFCSHDQSLRGLSNHQAFLDETKPQLRRNFDHASAQDRMTADCVGIS